MINGLLFVCEFPQRLGYFFFISLFNAALNQHMCFFIIPEQSRPCPREHSEHKTYLGTGKGFSVNGDLLVAELLCRKFAERQRAAVVACSDRIEEYLIELGGGESRQAHIHHLEPQALADRIGLVLFLALESALEIDRSVFSVGSKLAVVGRTGIMP